MSSPLNLSLEVKYREVPTDHGFCELCEEMMIGTMFQQMIVVAGEEIVQPVKICKYCYNDQPGEE
jgi:hypothetical protein